MKRRGVLVALAVGALVHVTAADAAAQACVGVPSDGGEYALAGGLGLTEGVTSYGAEYDANLEGPLAVAVGYTLSDLDGSEPNAHTFHGRIALEVPVSGVSACPVVGAAYSRLTGIYPTEQGDYDLRLVSIVLPVGFGVGKTIVMPAGFSVTPYAVPQYLYMQDRLRLSRGEEWSETRSDAHEYGGEAGLHFGVANFYFGGSVTLYSIEDTDPLYTLTVGWRTRPDLSPWP